MFIHLILFLRTESVTIVQFIYFQTLSKSIQKKEKKKEKKDSEAL